jgi:hypothetical protein
LPKKLPSRFVVSRHADREGAKLSCRERFVGRSEERDEFFGGGGGIASGEISGRALYEGAGRGALGLEGLARNPLQVDVASEK